MKRTMYATLAVTVALPMLAVPAAAQQDRGYGYGQSGEMPYRWSEQQGTIAPPDAYVGRGEAPNPPRTPGRYITDWDQSAQGRDYPEPPYTPDRYITDWDRQGGYGEYQGRAADDRWADRDPPRRDFDRPNLPPGYTDGRGYGPRYSERPYGGPDRGSYDRGWRDERGFDPYAHQGWGPPQDDRMRARMHDEMRAQMHDEMRARHHGYRDRDFRRDFAQDGRRGYYQDSRYEEMPRGQRRMGRRGGDKQVDMRELRRAMRMIDRFDIDKDGRVTQEEVDQYRSDRLSQFDTDGDQQLTLDEYAGLWADAMRERMVRRFQRHDRDGDGLVTIAEFSAQTENLVRMRDRDRDEALSEDDFMRPRVEAPLGGSPNEPAESEAVGDDDRADYGTRPVVEAPLEATPNNTGTETQVEEEEDDTSDTTTN